MASESRVSYPCRSPRRHVDVGRFRPRPSDDPLRFLVGSFRTNSTSWIEGPLCDSYIDRFMGRLWVDSCRPLAEHPALAISGTGDLHAERRPRRLKDDGPVRGRSALQPLTLRGFPAKPRPRQRIDAALHRHYPEVPDTWRGSWLDHRSPADAYGMMRFGFLCCGARLIEGGGSRPPWTTAPPTP